MTTSDPRTSPLPPGATVWVYPRDSGGDTQERSIPQQIEAIEAYCAAHSLTLEQVFLDEARPGSSADDRTGLWDLLAAARERFPEIHDRDKRVESPPRHGVIFWSFSRIARDRVEQAWIKSQLRIRGLVLISMSETILTGHELLDPILEELLAFKHEMDLAAISADARRGLHSVVQLRDDAPDFLACNPGWEPTGRYLGIFPGRVPPRGFKAERIRIGTRRSGKPHTVQRPVPDPETWDRARRAWEMRVVERATYKQIHAETHLFASSPSYSHFFGNRIYTGTFEFGELVLEDFVPALIPLEWYEVEQRRRAKRAKRRARGGSAQPGDPGPRSIASPRLLAGLLICKQCGRSMHAGYTSAGIRSDGRYRQRWDYYICAGYKSGKCAAGKVSAQALESAVLHRIRADVLNVNALTAFRDHLLEGLAEQRESLRLRIDSASEELRHARRAATNLGAAVAQHGYSDVLGSQLREAEETIARLQENLERDQVELAEWDAIDIDDEQVAQLVERACANLEAGDPLVVRRTLQALISYVEVDRTGFSHLVYSFPHPKVIPPAHGRAGERTDLYDYPPRGHCVYPLFCS